MLTMVGQGRACRRNVAHLGHTIAGLTATLATVEGLAAPQTLAVVAVTCTASVSWMGMSCLSAKRSSGGPARTSRTERLNLCLGRQR